MIDIRDINNTEKCLKFLSSEAGVSSTEALCTDTLLHFLNLICDNVYIDKNGNISGLIKADNTDVKTLMLEAHMDRIGLMVTKIQENGCLLFTNIGGVDERILPYSEVTVCGKNNLTGIIYPIKTDKETDIKSLQIDIGYTKEEAEKLVSVGDVVLLSSDFVNLCENTVSGAAFDNRAGILSILQAISTIDKSKLKYNISIMFSVEEELGLHGAYNSTLSYGADAVIVVDVTHGETRDTKGVTGVFPLGCGAVICRGPSLDYDYTLQLVSLCKENNILYDIEIATGSSGTTAWAFQTQAIPCMLISIPLKYMHTNLETLNLCDIESVSKLLLTAIEGGLIL